MRPLRSRAGGSTASFWRREPGPIAWLAIAMSFTAACIALWWFVTRPGGPVSPLFLPPPMDVVDAFVRLLARPYLGSTLGRHIASSLSVVIGGWLAAGLVGLPLGIAMGFGIAEFVKWYQNWPAVVPMDAIVTAVGFAGFVGVFFGFYPARKAAGLDPIEALRFE